MSPLLQHDQPHEKETIEFQLSLCFVYTTQRSYYLLEKRVAGQELISGIISASQ